MQLTQYSPLHTKSVLESVLRSDPEIPPCQCHKVMLLIVVIVVSPNLYKLPFTLHGENTALSVILVFDMVQIQN